ncbi:MAG: bacteriohemerythrin [Ideonella sp.]|nr:bacteriohemerythrin [Ideonella sp.]
MDFKRSQVTEDAAADRPVRQDDRWRRWTMPLAFAALLALTISAHWFPRQHLFDPAYCLPILALAWRRHRAGACVAAVMAALATTLLAAGGLQGQIDPGLLADRGAAGVLLFGGTALLANRVRSAMDLQHQEIETLEHRAFRDRLTGLPNRLLLLDRLAMAISQARRHNGKVALLIVDLDGFKAVNDQHGHSCGDEVLRAVASRMTACVRAGDTVARLGGDEFAIVLSQLERIDEAATVADKVRRAAAEPIAGRQGQSFRVGISVGISAFPDHGTEIDRLMANADAAMYQSKLRGKNAVTFCDAPGIPTTDADWFVFDKGHEIGVSEVDLQHRQLVLLINRLNQAVRAGEQTELIRKRFDELVLYTRFHFATEERLMDRALDPQYAVHKGAHARLLIDVAQYRDRLAQGGDLAALQTIKDWLLNHIDSDDQAMGAHLRQLARH